MSLLTLWTSGTTRLLESSVTKIIRNSPELLASYDAIDIAGCKSKEIESKIDEEFSKLVTVTMTDATLHIIAVMACWDQGAVEMLKYLNDACRYSPHNLSLHVLGLSVSFMKLFESTPNHEKSLRHQEEVVEELKRISSSANFAFSYTLIDDYASNGAAIVFSLESLAQYLAMVQIALAQDYYSILSPALLGAHGGDNLSIGLASLEFPKKETAKRLLGMGFLASLDNVGVNDKEVDAQKAAHEAEMFLASISDRYPRLYAERIRPLFRDKGLSEGRAVAEAADIIKDDLDQLRAEILGFLNDPEFTLPEKEAILAMILGRDNENIHGIQYEHEGRLLDDIVEEPINLYVEAFNKYCSDKNWLPVRGDFEELKINIWDEEKKEYLDLPENHEALNPLPEIKRLKQEILNTTSFLREKKEELESLKKSEDLRENAEEIRRQWHKPEGDLRDFEYKEQPLDDQYTPPSDLKTKETVDLRQFFPPARNQRDLGSCSSFAVASMYEATMKRNGVEGDIFMSPGYLFYYSNVLKGRPQGGSNYHDQLEVLGKHGICSDSLYSYDSSNPDRKPSKAAEDDAKQHRALAAKQIPLSKNSDKSQSLKQNHKLITSALSEGYPVGISLKVFDNLGQDGAFILHPRDAGAKEDGYHAMVIAGYSESNGFYIVRNSWGVDFGDEGYCYIPYAYIDDPEYLDFACIITEITDSVEGGKRSIPTVLADFAATESEIRIAAIRNAIASVRVDLEESQNLYSAYYKYYQKLMLALTMPKTQANIRKEAEAGQASMLVTTDSRRMKLEGSFVDKLKEYKVSLQKVIFSLFGAALLIGIGWYYTDSVVMMILFIVAAGLGVLVWLGYKWWVRIKRRELQEQLDEVAVEVQRLKETLLEMQIRFHVAGMWLSSFHKLSNEIGNVYERLVSFNDTLRQWQMDYTESVAESYPSVALMFRKLDAAPKLEKFFNDNKSGIVSRIDLMKIFKDYQANMQDLEISRNQLQSEVERAIEDLMKDFNIVNYLLGDRYDFLNPTELQKEIDVLIQVGQPSWRNPERNATSPVRMLIGNVENSRSGDWNSAIGPYFPLRPVMLQLADPNIIMLLTIHPVS